MCEDDIYQHQIKESLGSESGTGGGNSKRGVGFKNAKNLTLSVTGVLGLSEAHLPLREASARQNGWIFRKFPNGLWPPPQPSDYWKKVCTVPCFVDEAPLSGNCSLQEFVCWTYFLLESATLSMFSYTADNKTVAFFGWRDSLFGDLLTRVHSHLHLTSSRGAVCKE